MASIVGVVGGSGGLGRAIVDAIKADGHYEVVILSRKANPKLEEELGVRVLAADYSNPDTLVALLEENKIATVISALNAAMDTTPEMNLIQAADRSKATHRFIPNLWSAVIYKPKHVEQFPFAALRLQTEDALNKTGLEWTGVYPGIFMEYFVQGLPTHVARMPLTVDVDANVAAIPGSGNTPITFTYTVDIGKYVAKMLRLEKWDRVHIIAGDKKTWNEVVAIAEKSKGVKFDVTYNSLEMMEKGQVTELPGHKNMYEMFGGEAVAKPMVQGMMARFGIWQDEGVFVYKDGVDGTSLNRLFPEVTPLSMEEAWKQAGGKA